MFPQETTNETRKGPRKGNPSDDEDSDQGHIRKMFCQYHDTRRHAADQCTTFKTLVKQAKQEKSKYFDKKKGFT